jgi:anti-sigma regulatory factor (Ser/Thr protein kinase)
MHIAPVEWRFDSANALDARRLRREFMASLHAHGAGDFDAAELVCGELVGNAARHAPGRITVSLAWDDAATLTVHDEGPSFRPSASLPADPLAESGRGLYIVHALALDFHVEDVAHDGSRAIARLPVHRAA